MAKGKNFYSDKLPLIVRIVYLLVGITNFILGYALYFIVKDDKKKEYDAVFLKRGASIGAAMVLMGTLFWLVELIVDVFIIPLIK